MTNNNRKRITMSHTTYFQPTVHTARNYSQRTTALYAAAGMTAPASFHQALRRHLATLPGVQQVAASVASDAYTADADADVTEFWDDAVDQLIRAQGADTLKAALGTALATEEAASGHRALDRALADTHAWATRQARALVKAAKALPAGAAALDSEAVLAADAGASLVSARAALSALALVASLGDPAKHVSTIGDLARILPLVKIEGTVTEKLAPFNSNALNASQLDVTHAVRRLAQDVRRDPDLALVGVARGDYPGVTLSPADSLAVIGERARTAAVAFTRKTASEAEQRHLIAMR